MVLQAMHQSSNTTTCLHALSLRYRQLSYGRQDPELSVLLKIQVVVWDCPVFEALLKPHQSKLPLISNSLHVATASTCRFERTCATQ